MITHIVWNVAHYVQHQRYQYGGTYTCDVMVNPCSILLSIESRIYIKPNWVIKLIPSSTWSRTIFQLTIFLQCLLTLLTYVCSLNNSWKWNERKVENKWNATAWMFILVETLWNFGQLIFLTTSSRLHIDSIIMNTQTRLRNMLIVPGKLVC